MFSENERFHISMISHVDQYTPTFIPVHNYPPVLPTYELMYYLEGDTQLYFNGQTFHMTPGSMIYLPKGIPGTDYHVTVKQNFSVYNIYFDTTDPMPDHPIFFPNSSAELRELFEKLARTWFMKRDNYYYKSMQTAYRIFELVRSRQIKSNTQHKFAVLTASEDYMTLHYCDPNFDYDAFLALSGLSYSYFKKLFIEKHGMPPVKYLTRLKINRACELLQTKKFSVSEVAELCGFENIYYFSNVFKKIMGTSPSRYGEVPHTGD